MKSEMEEEHNDSKEEEVDGAGARGISAKAKRRQCGRAQAGGNEYEDQLLRPREELN